MFNLSRFMTFHSAASKFPRASGRLRQGEQALLIDQISSVKIGLRLKDTESKLET